MNSVRPSKRRRGCSEKEERGTLTRAAVEKQVSRIHGHAKVGDHFLNELVHYSCRK